LVLSGCRTIVDSLYRADGHGLAEFIVLLLSATLEWDVPFLGQTELVMIFISLETSVSPLL